MQEPKTNEYRSRVYTDRPAYADYDPPQKFQTIQSLIAKHLRAHPNAICSYSGGSDSDILIHLIERTRQVFPFLPPVKYAFFNTGLEMQATKNHVKATAEKYGVEITEYRPKVNIVQSTRKHGIPFLSKLISEGMERWQRKELPLTVADEYMNAEDKAAKRQELRERYPRSEVLINFLCGCNTEGVPMPKAQFSIRKEPYLLDFLSENPPTFMMSDHCCEDCKKNLAHRIQKDFDMIITGERRAEGGPRSSYGRSCFDELKNGQFRFRPLFYVSDDDKAWYKDEYKLRYSDAYEVYGLRRTGCCGCPISCRAVEDLEKIEPYEPNIVKAAWAIFGPSYLYRQKYNEYKAMRKSAKNEVAGQQAFDL